MSESSLQGVGRGQGLTAMLRTPFFWLAVVALGLTCFIYYPLFFPPSVSRLAIESEEFFFEANEAAGAPVLVLSLWLFYRRSHYRDLLLAEGSPALASPLLVLSALVYGWGHYTGAPDLQLASVIGILTAAVLMLGGRPALRAYWVPILFLAFALPLPPVLLSSVMFPIQLLTAQYAGLILNAMGVESLVQGDQILRPENTFIVIETCSGVRTIVTLTMLTVLLIDLFERRGVHALLLLLLAPVVAFLSNGIRVVTLVLNPHSSIHSIHNLQGIVMLLVGLSAIYVLDLLLERVFGDPEPQADESRSTQRSVTDARGRVAGAAGIVAALLVMVGMAQAITPWRMALSVDEMPDDLLVRVFGSGSREIEPDLQFRGSVRYLAHANRRIRIEGEPLEVFLGIAHEQLRPYTILSKRLAWPESGFVPIEESFVSLADLGDESGRELGEVPDARRMILRRGARSILSYSWFERAGSVPAEWLRHATAIDRSPLYRSEHMLAIRISTPIGRGATSLERAEDRIRAAWSRLAPEIEGYAPTVAGEGGAAGS